MLTLLTPPAKHRPNGLQCIAEQSIHAHQRDAENDYDTADPVCQIPLFLFS